MCRYCYCLVHSLEADFSNKVVVPSVLGELLLVKLHVARQKSKDPGKRREEYFIKHNFHQNALVKQDQGGVKNNMHVEARWLALRSFGRALFFTSSRSTRSRSSSTSRRNQKSQHQLTRLLAFLEVQFYYRDSPSRCTFGRPADDMVQIKALTTQTRTPLFIYSTLKTFGPRFFIDFFFLFPRSKEAADAWSRPTLSRSLTL